jgi:hypothetical protein
MKIDFEVDTREPVSVLAGMAERAEDFKPAFAIIRELLLSGIQRNFESRGSFLGKAWPGLAAATVARKSREGIPGDLLMGKTRQLSTALLGGAGKRTRVSRLSVRVGVKPSIYWANFAQAGAGGGRRGVQPRRRIIGMAARTELEAVTIIDRYLMHGRP